MNSFNQKNYLIFAGTSTIGQNLIKKLKSLNCNVFFTSRNKEKADEISKEFGYEYEICKDLSDFNAVEDVFKKVKDKFGSIDGVVNFSGSILLKAAHQTKYEEYIDVINKNLTTSFAITRGCGKYLNNGGSVVLISSIAGSIGIANHEAIASAKSAIEGLTRSAACTYATKNIRFNAVAPSLTKTNLSSAITENEMMLKASQSMHPLGRIGEKEDISLACEFLLNPENSWITGQIIKLDGGFSLKAKAKM
jgi:NAD(P)-dependent dehydrogenase (short-subunit alcohol dehydrogenase family)